jgi:toxin-antitoxin system PIN domain toxin
MIDVNVLVGAYRTDDPHHAELAGWLERAVNDPTPLAVTDAVLAGFVRVVTHPRVFAAPTPLETALRQASAVRDAAGTVIVRPGESAWSIFSSLCATANAKGNLVADALHAAVAIEAGATWVTLDHDFARFPGLALESPLTARR